MFTLLLPANVWFFLVENMAVLSLTNLNMSFLQSDPGGAARWSMCADGAGLLPGLNVLTSSSCLLHPTRAGCVQTVHKLVSTALHPQGCSPGSLGLGKLLKNNSAWGLSSKVILSEGGKVTDPRGAGKMSGFPCSL